MATEQRKLLNLMLDGKQGHLTAASVLSSSGVTVEGHMSDAGIHTPKSTIDSERISAIDTAVAALKSGDIKKLTDSLASTHKLVDDFVNGTPTNDGVMNRLVELVTQIEANKGTIDALLGDTLKKADLINDLTSGGVDKVLSAEQGKALKVLIDTLTAASHTHPNNAVLNGVGKAAGGNLTYNGKELNGETGIALMGSMSDTPAYTGKLQFVLSTVEVAV